jgi:hypothetical protein
MAKISRYLSLKLKLKVNREKSQVVKIEELEYLGFTFRGIRIFVSDRALKDFKHRLRGLTGAQLGRLDGGANSTIKPILARVDELLWHFPALHPN